MLKTAVSDIQELRYVQDMADQLKISTGRAQTYDEYCSLLKAAAITYDNSNKPKPSSYSHHQKRRVYQHDIDYSEPSSWTIPVDEPDFPAFNINTYIQDIYAYSAQRKLPYPRSDTSGHLPINIYANMDKYSCAA